jgi:hypothetical protein
MLEHVAGTFRIFARKGFAEGMSVHISLRDPEHPDSFWTNPFVTVFHSVLKPLLTIPDQTGIALWTDQGFGPDFARS